MNYDDKEFALKAMMFGIIVFYVFAVGFMFTNCRGF